MGSEQAVGSQSVEVLGSGCVTPAVNKSYMIAAMSAAVRLSIMVLLFAEVG